METYEIVNICPHCGNSTWFKCGINDLFFECAACGDMVNPEDMSSKARLIQSGEKEE